MSAKKNLLVSFSGGKTSAFMLKWILDNKSKEFNILPVFANTGKERIETLNFVRDVEKWTKTKIYWVESTFDGQKQSGFKVVSRLNCSLNGEVFEKMIYSYGLPNKAYPHCTRELKEKPIHQFAKHFFIGDEYFTAIGIRSDEIDRMSANAKEKKYIYPLISWIPTTKKDIISFWQKQKFTLELKEHQGNCDFCWKKSFKKLEMLIKEDENSIKWWDRMEEKYGEHVPEHRKRKPIKNKITFFRGNKSAKDLIFLSKQKKLQQLIDFDNSNGCEDSCEIY